MPFMSKRAKANAEMVLDGMLEAIQTAVDNDILLGMGTDSALTFVTHYNAWREIDFAIRYGNLSPERALHNATQANARQDFRGFDKGQLGSGAQRANFERSGQAAGFDGLGNGAGTRQYSNRGQTSRQSMSQSASRGSRSSFSGGASRGGFSGGGARGGGFGGGGRGGGGGRR